MDEIVFPYEEDEDLNNKIVYYKKVVEGAL